jgi:hypothetical protein
MRDPNPVLHGIQDFYCSTIEQVWICLFIRTKKKGFSVLLRATCSAHRACTLYDLRMHSLHKYMLGLVLAWDIDISSLATITLSVTTVGAPGNSSLAGSTLLPMRRLARIKRFSLRDGDMLSGLAAQQPPVVSFLLFEYQWEPDVDAFYPGQVCLLYLPNLNPSQPAIYFQAFHVLRRAYTLGSGGALLRYVIASVSPHPRPCPKLVVDLS